jgi:hypothetical protein
VEYFDDKFPLERALKRAVAYRRVASRYPSIYGSGEAQYYQLYSFAFAAVCAHAGLSSGGQTRLCGYLKDGLKSDYGLAPVALEMAVAVHFWAADFDVEFTDMEGRGQFDFLASGAGIELEIDCKAVSGDVGRIDPSSPCVGPSPTLPTGYRGMLCQERRNNPTHHHPCCPARS